VVHCVLYVCQHSWTCCVIVASKHAVRMSRWVGDVYFSMAPAMLVCQRAVAHSPQYWTHCLRVERSLRFIDIVASVACIYRCAGGGSSSSVFRLILLVLPWLNFTVRDCDRRQRQIGLCSLDNLGRCVTDLVPPLDNTFAATS
jgi:hypothetical protein